VIAPDVTGVLQLVSVVNDPTVCEAASRPRNARRSSEIARHAVRRRRTRRHVLNDRRAQGLASVNGHTAAENDTDPMRSR